MAKGQSPQDFESYLNKFRRAGGIVKSLLNVCVVSIPIYFYGPEHERRVFDALSVAVAAVAVSFLVFAGLSGKARRRILRNLRLSFATTVIFALVYLGFYAYFTGRDSSGDRYVKGFSYSPQILEYKALAAKKRQENETAVVFTEDDEFVANFGNDPRKVWVPSSIDLMGGAVRLFGLLPLAASLVWSISCIMLLLPPMSQPRPE
jgi:flagellar basal body-associated protein FliL